MIAVVTGLVHPMHGGWRFEKPQRFSFRDGTWTLVLQQSQFHVFIEGTEPSDLGTFLNEVGSVVQGCLDSLGFHLATPLRADISSMVIDGNRLMHRSSQWPELLAEVSNFVDEGKLGPFIGAACEEPLIRLALADLRSALESPDETVMLCFRAIESVRQWFLQGDSDDGQARKESWVAMRTTLNVSQDDIRSLERLAMDRRHGGVAPPPAADRERAMRLARDVVARLIDHRSNQAVQPS